MIIIGEKLNSSIPFAQSAMNSRDAGIISTLIKNQIACGAHYLDINTAVCENELDTMLWMLKIANDEIHDNDCGIMIDTTSGYVAETAASAIKGRKIIINSVTLTDRFDELLPVIKKYNTGVVALPMGDFGIPATAAERADNAKALIERLKSEGISEERIYIDAMVEALATGQENPTITLDTIASVKAAYPNVNTVCGLSNVSFGLPKRACINTAFLAMAVHSGLDAAIMDITSKPMRDMLYAAQALCGRDEYCMDYITYMREE